MEENTSWTGSTEPLNGDPNAPYINNTLIPVASHAEQYFDDIHPSLPNYIETESGDNQGIIDDNPPYFHKLTTSNHLVTYLTNAGLTWKAYLEDTSGTTCPFKGVKQYVPRHNGTIYFTDVNGNLNASYPYCISHERPFTELSADLQKGAVSNFNYIVPNLCHNFHGGGSICGSTNLVSQGDNFLHNVIPQITATQQYQTAGAIIVWFDEGRDNPDGSDSSGPLPFIVLSPFAKGNGYSNTISYNHFSTLKTLQEIFGLTPLLGHAADASVNDFSDLFQPGVINPLSSPTQTPTPDLSVTPSSIATSTQTPTPDLSATPSSTPTPSPITGIIAYDTFQRPNQSFWGTASDGNVWGGSANNNTAFSINTNTGQIKTSSAANLDAILGPSVANVEVLLSGSMTSFGAGVNTFGPVLRWTGPKIFYRALLSGSSFVIQKDVNGTVTNLKSVSFTAIPNTSYFIRFNATGTTLSAKAWQSGTQEPASWMVTVTDSSLAAGYAGIRTYQQSGVTTSITSFQATQQ